MERVADGVFVHSSTLLRNNAVIVQGFSGALLVDPGLTNDEMADLAAGIRDLGQRVAAGFATHPDWDHVLWHPAFGQAPRYGTARCAADMRELRAKQEWTARVAEAMPTEIVDDVTLEGFGEITGLAADDRILPWDGPAVRVIEHRAHAAGHAALLLEEQRVLVAGDMLSDVFPPMLDLDAADPIGDYLAALMLFDELVDDVDVVIPGHGSVAGAGGLRVRIDLDRAYLRALHAGHVVDDPRIGPSAEPGWEWVSGIHDGQLQRLQESGKL